MRNGTESEISTWNVWRGGHSDYTPTGRPDRWNVLSTALSSLKVDALGVTDSHRWHTDYTGEEIARYFGFQTAHCIPLRDARLDKDSDIGVSLLSNAPVLRVDEVRLETRNGLLAEVELYETQVQMGIVYLDDLNEELRLRQAEALVAAFDKDKPAIIAGDLNSVNRRDYENWLSIARYLQGFPQLAGVFFPGFQELMKGETIKYLESQGFVDPGVHLGMNTVPTPAVKVRNTIPMLFPLFRVDYLLYRGKIQISNLKTHRGGIFNEASDHYPITGTVTIDESQGTIYSRR